MMNGMEHVIICNHSNQFETREFQDYIKGTASHKAREIYNAKDRHSKLQDQSHSLPQFSHNEIALGSSLGKSSFCSIFELWWTRGVVENEGKAAHLSLPPTTTAATAEAGIGYGGKLTHTLTAYAGLSADREAQSDEDVKAQRRLFIAQSCTVARTHPKRYQCSYVVKVIDRNCPNLRSFVAGTIQMATETRLLSSLGHHPNVIKLWAVSTGYDPFDGKSFMVMDKLYDTLQDRMQTWKQRNFRGRVLFWGAGHRQKRRLSFQLLSAHDLASALAHVHSHRIVHRNVKPRKVGFNVHDGLVLFDFGLARELPPHSDAIAADGLYRMTVVGSYRYMAPEVGKKERYNEKSDVYGFAILCWEIFSFKTAYNGLTVKMLETKVWNGPRLRPKTSAAVIGKKTIEAMLELAWSDDVASRPTMEEIVVTLEKECLRNDIDVSVPRSGSTIDTGSRIHYHMRRQPPVRMGE